MPADAFSTPEEAAAVARGLLAAGVRLRPRERAFLEGMVGLTAEATRKQRAWLLDITAKVQRRSSIDAERLDAAIAAQAPPIEED